MNILIIGPYAPHGQVGAVRILSLSKHLVEQGNKVTVLCLSRRSLKKMVPAELCSTYPEGVDTVTYDLCPGGSSLLVKGMRQASQFKHALGRLLSKRKFDVALISGGPFYTFPASALLRKRDIPYVVDYRDLNVSCKERRKRDNVLSAVKYWLTFPVRVWQEWPCVRGAEAITVVHQQMKKNICAFFRVSQEKVYICLNGFDEQALEGIKLNQEIHPGCDGVDENSFTIGYFGKLMYYDYSYTISFFQAVSQLREDGLNVRVRHIGPSCKALEELLAINAYDMRSWYVCTGLMEYRAGMQELSCCDAFYLEYVAPEGPGTKVFDYIFINKPVIAMIKEGIALQGFLGRFPGAYICHSTEDITDALSDAMKGGRKKLLDDADRMHYSRTIQNAKFEEVLSLAAARNIGSGHIAQI